MKPTGYFRQEKDEHGNTKKIFELMDDGSEVETGYKHAYDSPGIDVGWWETILAFIIFVPIFVISFVKELWRWRK